jgi:hypothetical protein
MRTMEASPRLSPGWGIIFEFASTWGLVDGWFPRRLAWGRYRLFGNDDGSLGAQLSILSKRLMPSEVRARWCRR